MTLQRPASSLCPRWLHAYKTGLIKIRHLDPPDTKMGEYRFLMRFTHHGEVKSTRGPGLCYGARGVHLTA